MKKTKALLGAGCFWGIEEVFRKITGIIDTKVGYAGGSVSNPTYQDVCSGTTGHTEVLLIEFDPDQISYEKILETFWSCHDPTQLNRQGPDIGEQYKSVIFYFSEDQKKIAEKSRKEFQKKINDPIVTKITPNTTFYIAEVYHQRYIQKNTSFEK